MVQEDKELLLKDLCARLPYHPIVYVDEDLPRLKLGAATIVWKYIAVDKPCKPYLRSISLMTGEEKEELKEIGSEYLAKWENAQDSIDKWRLDAEVSYKRSEFYNSHLLDWRGLIPKGLALEAPKDMYNIK